MNLKAFLKTVFFACLLPASLLFRSEPFRRTKVDGAFHPCAVLARSKVLTNESQSLLENCFLCVSSSRFPTIQCGRPESRDPAPFTRVSDRRLCKSLVYHEQLGDCDNQARGGHYLHRLHAFT